MRSLRISKTFNLELAILLSQGVENFGSRVVAGKRAIVYHTIETVIINHPVRPADPDVGICAYFIRKTPFVVLYDYDDTELRVYLVIHSHADRTKVDLSKVVW